MTVQEAYKKMTDLILENEKNLIDAEVALNFITKQTKALILEKKRLDKLMDELKFQYPIKTES